MDKKKIRAERIKYFILGILVVSGLFLLTGASLENATPTLNFGRYQISSWGTSLGEKGGAMGVFIVDTVSGETKTVYTRIYGSPGKGKVIKNNLKKPFSAMQ
ncbi:MAG: hypothetical protein KAJ45_02745 [Desulfobulbaceae bacterium]|nr:hypothetical protein [Desulfobulbaceae bacterium]MCK5545546.1 hypothetical protein [Desulfobulbaceae bacterium]